MSLRVLINNSYVELDADNVLVPLTFSVADMKQPDKRRTSSSKTITLQGTQRNLNILRNIYSLPYATFEDSTIGFIFDPRTRIEAKYEENGVLIFDGLFQVLKARRIGERYEFECLLFSNIANVIQELGDLRLTDLDWSEYQHQLDTQVVIDSWDDQVIQNGSAVSNFTGGVPDGFGYIYGWFDMGMEYPNATHPRTQRTNQIPLGVYFKETLQKIMGFIGQPYTFTLDNTELWKRLVLFNEGGQINEITQQDKDDREVDVDYVAENFTFIDFFNIQQNLLKPFIISAVNIDALNQTDGTDIQIALSGNYRFNFIGTFDYALSSGSFLVRVEVLINGVFIENIYDSGNVIFPNSPTLSYNQIREYSFENGDILTIRKQYFFGISTEIQINDGSFSTNMVSIDGEIQDGSDIDITRYLPKMKCADFYKSIMRMFNLYQEDQPDGSILIVPAINYYQGTNSNETEDWSDLVDYSEVVEIEPPNRIEGKNYQFKYTEENDFYHDAYRQEFAQNYGDFTYTVPNTWQQGDNTVQLNFSLGIPVELKDNGTDTGVVMPTIYTQKNGQTETYKGKGARIYVYNGYSVISSTYPCLVNSSDDATSTLIESGSDAVQPLFHHMLNPAAPTFDISFGQVQRLYYIGGSVTNANLYFTYWDKFIRELTSEDSKILTAYFKLKTIDIHRLDFRKLKNIDGVVYRLNLVEDYIGQESTTKCELIKVIEGQNRLIQTGSVVTSLTPFIPKSGLNVVSGSGVIPVLELGQFGLNTTDELLYIGVAEGRVLKIN